MLGTKSGAAVGRLHAVFDRAAVVKLRAAGRSWREIAAALGGVSTGTARTPAMARQRAVFKRQVD